MICYPIYFNSWTGGNFLSYFINQHLDTPAKLDILQTKGLQHVQAQEMYSASLSAEQVQLKATRSHTTTEEVRKVINNTSAINIDESMEYDMAAPLLFHDVEFYDKRIFNSVHNTVKPIYIYWEPVDTFLVNRMIRGHNMSAEAIDNNINTVTQQQFLKTFRNDNVYCIRMQYLLNGDESEYNKLLDFINRPAITDWKNTIQQYLETVSSHV
jgi:hypothetical protein